MGRYIFCEIRVSARADLKGVGSDYSVTTGYDVFLQHSLSTLHTIIFVFLPEALAKISYCSSKMGAT